MNAKMLAQRRKDYATRLENALGRLVGVLAGLDEVERISVFGSYAQGRRDLGTDLDVLVIVRSDEPFLDRLRLLYSKAPLDVDLDLLCYTGEEWAHMQETPWGRKIRREEIVLHEKNPSGRG